MSDQGYNLQRTRRQVRTNDTSKLPAYYARYKSGRRFYMEMAVVFDVATFEKYGKSKDTLHDRASQIATLVNSVFQPVNIHVALVGVEIWSDKDAFPIRPKGEEALRDFVHYRQHVLLRKMPNDVAVLITDVQFKSGVVGRGLQGTICSAKSSGAMASDHSHDVYSMAITIAHEIGHNFGMPHDTSACECAMDACIMAPTVRASHSIYWSTCSLEYLSWSLQHGGEACLQNEPRAVLNGPLCGNGFLEDGEQCDCGLPHMCDNPCCDAKTCKFREGSVCANGDCCDLSTCQLKPKASVCRGQQNECDLPEYCDGKTEVCPADTYKHDGELCANGDAHCYDGQCGSLSERCRRLWGDSGRPAHHYCYSFNGEGTPHGSCGMNRFNDSYVKCAPQDMNCGLLQCEHKNEKTQYGSKSTSITYSTMVSHGSAVFNCQTALIDVGDDRKDPGLVPNGAPCGPGKMCVDQKCVVTASLRAKQYCLNDCSGHGVCNNFAHCHCDAGYGGVDCSIGGLGGSLDSGPASAYSGVHAGVGIAVFFFVVLPLLAAAFFLLYRKGLLKRFGFKGNRMIKLLDLRRSPTRKSKARKVSSWVTQGVIYGGTQERQSRMVPQKSVVHSASNNVVPPVTLPSVTDRIVAQLKTVSSQSAVNGGATVQRPVFKFSTLQAAAQDPLRRSTERPKIPAPPRPPSPTRLSGERVYCEIHPVGSPSEQLTAALSALADPGAVMPQRRAPPPPSGPPPPPQQQSTVKDFQRLFEGGAGGKKVMTLDRNVGNAMTPSISMGDGGSLRRNESLTASQRRPQQAPPPPPKPSIGLMDMNRPSNASSSSSHRDVVGQPPPPGEGLKVAQLKAKFLSK